MRTIAGQLKKVVGRYTYLNIDWLKKIFLKTDRVECVLEREGVVSVPTLGGPLPHLPVAENPPAYMLCILAVRGYIGSVGSGQVKPTSDARTNNNKFIT